MSVQIAFSRLENVELLRNFSAAEAEDLMAVCDEARYQAGDTILETGQQHRALYMLLEGTVEVDLEVPKLGQRVMVQLSPPSVFGESSFYHANPHSATVRCLSAAHVIRLDRSQYDTLLARNSLAAFKLGANAAAILATRLQHTDQWIVDMLEQQQEHKHHESYLKFRERMGLHFGSATQSIFTPGGL